MEKLEVAFKVVGIVLSVLGLAAAVYNIISGRAHQKRLAQENRDLARLDAVCVLAAKNEQRVNGLEGRFGTFEQRIEHRIDKIADDIGKVKDLFTDYLIKH